MTYEGDFCVKRNISSYYYSLSVVFECVYIMLHPYNNNIDFIIFFYLVPQVFGSIISLVILVYVITIIVLLQQRLPLTLL
jgi:hypothetical protein